MATLQTLPTQVSRTRFRYLDIEVEVEIDWRRVHLQTRDALVNKSRRSTQGPLTVKVVGAPLVVKDGHVGQRATYIGTEAGMQITGVVYDIDAFHIWIRDAEGRERGCPPDTVKWLKEGS